MLINTCIQRGYELPSRGTIFIQHNKKIGSAPVLPPSSERLVAKNKDGYDFSVPLREGGQDGKSIVLYSPRIAHTAHISLYVYEE
jgi:hypothetical protein